MNAPAPPPAQQKPAAEGTTVTLSGGFGAIWGALMILPILFLFLFHLGAGYLSYQKYGNIGWAILNFFFAYFYYPYYAFFLANAPSEVSSTTTMMGGLRKLFKGRR